ncbi:Uncharacterised protein [Segatella copri]|nr:Uncharacterised protein [Segatella copri]
MLQKVEDETIIVQRYWREIVRSQGTNHSYTHFLVWIIQLIALQDRVILLDGEIPTLIKQW